jgi:hypothetical protein
MKTLQNFLFIAILTATPLGSGATLDAPIRVSIIQLIATPEKFDGKLVSIIGFIHIGREQDLLYLGEEDFNYGVAENALWFHLSEEMGKDWQKLNRNYVGIVGIFSARHEGPYGCPNGGIAQIKKYAIWSLQNNPIGKTLDQPKPQQ